MTLTHPSIDPDQIIQLVLAADSVFFDEAAVSDIHTKGASDYVTKVDLGVQHYLQEALFLHYPEIGFIGEEQERFQADPGASYWILDPVDGTTNLIHHYRMSAVSLALYEKGQITFGVVYNPFSRELFSASRGQGAYLNGKPIHVSSFASLSEALISYGSSPYEKQRSQALFALYETIYLHCSDFRRCGSAALDLCFVACGRQDAYLEPNLKPWDYAAGALILTEAGGRIGTWQPDGQPPYLDNADILATNGLIDQALRALL